MCSRIQKPLPETNHRIIGIFQKPGFFIKGPVLTPEVRIAQAVSLRSPNTRGVEAVVTSYTPPVAEPWHYTDGQSQKEMLSEGIPFT